MDGFNETALGQILTFQRGFDITKKEQTLGEVPIVSSSGISSYHNEFKVKGPGVVIGRKGTLGTVHFISQNFWPHDTTLWVKDFKDNDPKFIYYFLQTLHLEKFDTGSSNPTLNRNHAHKIKVLFPNICIQKKIAAILSAYDDLIENNKKRIQILENMAEELYKEWFVRFRFPNWENTEFEKGLPVGWKNVRFDSFCKFKKGKNPEEILNSPDDAVMYINMESLTGEGTSYARKQKNSVECSIGDLLMLMDGSRSGLVFRANNMGIVGSTLSIIEVNNKFKNYVFEYLKAMKTSIVSNNTGSAIPHANKDYINRMLVCIPDNLIISKFNEIYDSQYLLIKNLQQQIKWLEQTKTALLPRLISGKLSVENLDIQFPPSMQEQ